MAELITIEEATQGLRDAITEGIGSVELQALVTKLAATSGTQVNAIQRIADAVKDEHQAKSAIAS